MTGAPSDQSHPFADLADFTALPRLSGLALSLDRHPPGHCGGRVELLVRQGTTGFSRSDQVVITSYQLALVSTGGGEGGIT